MQHMETVEQMKARIKASFDKMVADGIDAKQAPFEIAYLDRVLRSHAVLLGEAVNSDSPLYTNPPDAMNMVASAMAFIIDSMIINAVPVNDPEMAIRLANGFMVEVANKLTEYLESSYPSGGRPN